MIIWSPINGNFLIRTNIFWMRSLVLNWSFRFTFQISFFSLVVFAAVQFLMKSFTLQRASWQTVLFLFWDKNKINQCSRCISFGIIDQIYLDKAGKHIFGRLIIASYFLLLIFCNIFSSIVALRADILVSRISIKLE